jgi:hypothetical protein
MSSSSSSEDEEKITKELEEHSRLKSIRTAEEESIIKKARKKILSSGGYVGVHDTVDSIYSIFKANTLKTSKKLLRYVVWEEKAKGRGWASKNWHFEVSFPSFKTVCAKRLKVHITHHELEFDVDKQKLVYHYNYSYYRFLKEENNKSSEIEFDSFEDWKEYIILREKQIIEKCREVIEKRIVNSTKRKALYLRLLPTGDNVKLLPYTYGLKPSLCTISGYATDGESSCSDSASSCEKAFKRKKYSDDDSDSDIADLVSSDSYDSCSSNNSSSAGD